MEYVVQDNDQLQRTWYLSLIFPLIIMFSVGTASAAVVPINETSLDYAREHLGRLDFSLNVSKVVYKGDSLIIGITYENLTTYTTYFVSSDHFVIDGEGNRTQIARYTGAIGSYDLSTEEFPYLFHQNGTYLFTVVLHRKNYSDIVRTVSFLYYHFRRPCVIIPSEPVVSILIREDFGGFLFDVVIYHDGAVKSKKRRFYHEETVYKSGNISQEELYDLLHYFSERGFAEMNKSYEWRVMTDAASGIIRVNSESICNSIEEYPFRENPYAPAALHEIEERILQIEKNATKSLPAEIRKDLPVSIEPSKNQRTKSSPAFQIFSIVVIIFFIHSVLRVRRKMR